MNAQDHDDCATSVCWGCDAYAKGRIRADEGNYACQHCHIRIGAVLDKTTRAHVSTPQPTLSEYVQPAYCEPDDEDEPPSEWRSVALFLVIALIALIGVALVYGTARASTLGPDIVDNVSVREVLP